MRTQWIALLAFALAAMAVGPASAQTLYPDGPPRYDGQYLNVSAANFNSMLDRLEALEAAVKDKEDKI